jgi:predicted dehydrogenase
MDTSIGIGVLGAGYWGRHFIRIVKETVGSHLVAVSDLDADVCNEVATMSPGILTTTDPEELIGHPGVDAVIIATPVVSHFELAYYALRHHKHVLCEKPLTSSSEQARTLLGMSRKVGRVLMVGHTFEYNSVVLHLRDVIDKGQLGELFYITMQRSGPGPVRNDVNVVLDLATHDVSMLLHWLGEMPLSVSASGMTVNDSGLEDVAFIEMDFPSLCASIHVSWLDPVKQRIVKVVGSEGMAVFDDTSLTGKLKIHSASGQNVSAVGGFGDFQLSGKGGEVTIPHIIYHEPLRVEFGHFLDCVRSGDTPCTDAENGIRVLQVLEAVNLSMRQQGRRIAL